MNRQPAARPRRKVWLFNMHPLAAWPLAYFLGLALLFALVILFAGTSIDQTAYIVALFAPVGMVPLIARAKGMSPVRWGIGSVMVALMHTALPVPFIHPLPVLLAVIFHHPPRPHVHDAPAPPEHPAATAPPAPRDADSRPTPSAPSSRRDDDADGPPTIGLTGAPPGPSLADEPPNRPRAQRRFRRRRR